MTPISDIEKLERLLAACQKATDPDQFRLAEGDLHIAIHNLTPSLVADWRAMRGEIERLTKERDEAHERAAQVCDGLSDLHANGEVWISACEMCADDIRALKAKEE